MDKRIVLPGLLLLALGGLVGCNRQDTNNIAQDTRHLAQDTGKALDSAGLIAKVNATLADTKGVDVKNLHVEAQNGVVTITGHVRTAAERGRIKEVVMSIHGVNSVNVNNLRVQQ